MSFLRLLCELSIKLVSSWGSLFGYEVKLLISRKGASPVKHEEHSDTCKPRDLILVYHFPKTASVTVENSLISSGYSTRRVHFLSERSMKEWEPPLALLLDL